MKRVIATPSIKYFEEVLNRPDIDIIKIDVKAVEQTIYFQDCFFGIIVFEERTNA